MGLFGRRKKDEDFEDEFEDEEYDDEYEDDYDEPEEPKGKVSPAPVRTKAPAYDDDEEYEDDYEDDDYDVDDYDDDDYDDEPRRNPLKGVVVVLVILLLVMGAIIALLYLRMQSAETKASELETALNKAQTELNVLKAGGTLGEGPMEVIIEANPGTSVPEPTEEPAEPEATPASTPEPTPEPTPDITPDPAAAVEPTPGVDAPAPEAPAAPAASGPLKDTVTDEMLGGVLRPKDGSWFEAPKKATVNAFMLATHWGSSMDWNEKGVLRKDDKVELLAMENGWYLLRDANNNYGWAASPYLTERAG